MRHKFKMIIGSLLMCLMALVAAFTSMRLALHGREVVVPNLAGRPDEDAAAMAKKLGLNLSVENRFYSAGVAPNHVLSQSPAAGARVRRGWQVRVTESLGGQRIAVPDVTGQTERPASLVLRRLQLEVGTIAHLPAPAPTGVVLAQSPPPNAVGLDGPRVALLVSDDEAAPSTISFVMPQITGMTLGAAGARLGEAGLHMTVQSPVVAPATFQGPAGSKTGPAVEPAPDPAIPVTIVPPPTPSPNAVITSQSPAPGHRVSRADNVRVTVLDKDGDGFGGALLP